MTPSEIKTLIDHLVASYSSSTLWLYALNHPGVQKIIKIEFDDPKASLELGRRDGTSYTRHLHTDLESAKMNPSFNLSHMRFCMMTCITMLHDEMVRSGLSVESEVQQFLRHLRNACGHGNRFHFKSGEPSKPAKFGSLEIDASLQGMENVLFEYIYPGEVFDLFDEIRRQV